MLIQREIKDNKAIKIKSFIYFLINILYGSDKGDIDENWGI